MASRGDDVLPLVSVVKKPSPSLGRTTSCVSNPKSSALEALNEGNLQLLCDLLNEVPSSPSKSGDVSFDVNQPYQDCGHKTLLHLAAESGDAEAVKLILGAGADVNSVNRLTQLTPLHAAVVKEPREDVFRILLAAGADVNAAATGGKTVLHHLVKKCFDPKHEEAALRCLRMLTAQRGLEVDKEDQAGSITALYLAANSSGDNYLPVLRSLLSAGADWSLKCGDDKSIRETIKSQVNRRDFKTLEQLNDGAFALGGKSLGSAVKESLMNMIEEAELSSDDDDAKWEEFKKALDEAPMLELEASSPGEVGLIQRSAEAGLARHLKSLLDKQLDPNRFTKGTTPAVVLAARQGNDEVLKILRDAGGEKGGGPPANFAVVDERTKASVLHSVLRKSCSDGRSLRFSAAEMDERYSRCLDVLLGGDPDDRDSRLEHQLRRVINTRDELDNTALHYATQLWPQSVVRRLLERGANIGVKNAFAEMPVESILPSTMEDFLNEHCMTSRGDPTNKDFRVTVRYDFLAPPRDGEDLVSVMGRGSGNSQRREGWTGPRNGGVSTEEDKQKPGKGDEEEANVDYRADDPSNNTASSAPPLPETEVLWHMSQSAKLRHLLQHPVIASFLWLKWKRIGSAYNKNVAFYLAFVACLTAYILSAYGGSSVKSGGGKIVEEDCGGGEKVSGIVNVLWYLNAVLVAILFVREMFQFGIAPRRYFFSAENCLEVCLIGLTVALLFYGGPSCHVSAKRHFSAAIIVLAWAELVTMVGRHPVLSTINIYVTMFYRVTWTFVMFLLWYSFFIVAFALGFYVLLHKDDGDEPGPDEYHFFNTLGLAVVKTFTMFVGELEFGDLPIETGWGYLFFLAFIFMIVVIMMNLLNGLAVGDCGLIRQEAEINFYLSQVEVVSYVESMLLGDPFNFLSNWPAFIWLKRIPACSLGSTLYRVPPLRYIFHKITGASNILLFYDYLPEKKVSFYPNHDPGLCGCLGGGEDESISDGRTPSPFFSPHIMEAAKQWILEHNRAKDSAEERLARTEEALRQLTAQTKRMEETLTFIANKIK